MNMPRTLDLGVDFPPNLIYSKIARPQVIMMNCGMAHCETEFCMSKRATKSNNVYELVDEVTIKSRSV
jgi:hypothetical protein